MHMNKQGTQFYWNILLLHERHRYIQSRGSVASKQLTQPFSSRNPGDSPEALAHFPFIPSPKCMSRVIMMSLNDVRIICTPISVGKALHMCRGIAKICLHLCQCPHELFSSTMQEPCCIFYNPNFGPVTYIFVLIVGIS